ncbi:MAG: hypothetical protein E7365_01670 [Clostridiales bacterium]|nr:hypothetical protein [Clostridiales bacterium]
MKNFLKIICLMLVFACVLSLSACKPDKDGQNSNTQGVEQTTAAPTPTSFDLDDEDVFITSSPTVAPSGSTSGTQNPSSTSTANATQGAGNTTPTPTPVPPPSMTPSQPTTSDDGNIQLPFDTFN